MDDELLTSVRAKLAFCEKVLRSERDGLMAFDRSYRYVYWNAEMERITGLCAGEVLGKCAFEVFPFLIETGEHRRFEDALAGRTAASRDRPFTVPETRRQGYYEASYAPIEDESGVIVAGVAVVRDVSAERAAEAQLRETEERFRNMADVSPVLMWMSGPDSLCTFFNARWLSFTGRTLEQELGLGWAEGVHADDLQQCLDGYTAAFNERRVFELEYRLRRADGEYRWVLDRGTPRHASDGAFAGYIGSCIDITEYKHLEDELRKAVQARDDFLSIASHELRTPLTTLVLATEKMLRRLRRLADTDDAVANSPMLSSLVSDGEAAEGQVQRLCVLVEDLLDVSRLASGRFELVVKAVDLTELAREITARLDDAARLSDSRLELDADQAVVCKCDRARIERVVLNLVSNAMKYGAGKPVRIRVEQRETTACIAVRDEGIGIPLEHQRRIFEQFERAVSTRHYGGFGLGLWIARQLVEAHGGYIELVSAPAKGATFTVQLPVDGPPKG